VLLFLRSVFFGRFCYLCARVLALLFDFESCLILFFGGTRAFFSRGCSNTMAQAQHEMEAEAPAIEHATERGMPIAQLEVRFEGVSWVLNFGGLKHSDEPLFVLSCRLTLRWLSSQQHGIGAADIKKLQEAGYNTIESIAFAAKKVLAQVKGITEAKAEKLHEAGMTNQRRGAGAGRKGSCLGVVSICLSHMHTRRVVCGSAALHLMFSLVYLCVVLCPCAAEVLDMVCWQCGSVKNGSHGTRCD
jgi:hypothetical protein